jgi:hypothetical protein
MKICNYVKTKEVTLEELETNFKKVQVVQINEDLKEGCYCCGMAINVDKLRTRPRLICRYCKNCNSINLVYRKFVAGRVERVMIFKEKLDTNAPFSSKK